jgi:hypothetical protein
MSGTSTLPSHLSFGNNTYNTRFDPSLNNVRPATGSYQISKSSIQGYTSPVSVIPPPVSNNPPLLVSPAMPITTTQTAPKMTVLHRPDVYSVNMEQNRQYNAGSLLTIK